MTQQASPPRVETPGISQEVLWEALQEVEQAEANQQMMAQIRTERKAISDLMQTLTADGHFFPPQTPQHWGRVIKDVIRADFQQRNIPLHEWKPRHSYHLVDPSPWPISGSLGALATTVGGVMYMHSFQGGATLLSLGLIFLLYTMFVWWRDVLRESTLEGHHTKVVQLGLRYGTLFSIICGIRQYLGHLTKEHHVGFEAAAWYWHFVDVVRCFPVSRFFYEQIEEPNGSNSGKLDRPGGLALTQRALKSARLQ
ncbi:hypothetical protein HYC85_004426 [Camellia sinensis]|uniref:Cytochrome c oxidase subunit 3 n=1 Tax=Camellia sinensis TaxID=4442 RepID=A0A7J7HY94_CAMSI|nr:hypothetical protein HYC85_004426 [Camellia sinensis]